MVTRRCSKNRGQWVTRFACQLPPTTCPRIPAPTSNLTLIFRISFVALFPYQKSLINHCSHNGGILLANLLQSSSSTFSCVSFPGFFAFQEGMWDTHISALLSSPTVRHEPGLSTEYGNSEAISSRVSGGFQKCLATRQLILQSGLLKGVPGSKPYSSYPDCPLKLARQDVCQIGIMV
jgi:hypothetical protein